VPDYPGRSEERLEPSSVRGKSLKDQPSALVGKKVAEKANERRNGEEVRTGFLEKL